MNATASLRWRIYSGTGFFSVPVLITAFLGGGIIWVILSPNNSLKLKSS
jgi:hypothetical protein